MKMLKPPFEVRWHQDEQFRENMADDEWLSIVGANKWIVCSHDAKWQLEAAALKAIQQHKVGCFYLWECMHPELLQIQEFGAQLRQDHARLQKREAALYLSRYLFEPTEEGALMTDSKSQSDKFKEAAREHEADEDEGRWEERLKKIAKAKPEKSE